MFPNSYYVATCIRILKDTRLYINSPEALPPPALLCQGKATHRRSRTSPEGEGTGGAGPEEEGQIKRDLNVLGVCE